MNAFFKRWVFAFLAMTLSCSVAQAASILWSGAGDGISWNSAANWSGGVVPGSNDDVVIGVIAGNPTIQISSSPQVHSLTTSAPVAIAGSLYVASGITLNNATLTLGIGNSTGTIYFRGTQTLGGTGHVAMIAYGSSLYSEGGNSVATAAILTIGPNITIDATASSNIEDYYSYDSVINQGVINSNTSGVTIYLPDTFTNHGTVEATAGTLNIGSKSWSGTGGTIGLSGSGVLTLAGTFSTSTLGTWNRTGGTVNFTGTLNNTGTTLALTAGTGSWNLNNATINGGTITASGGATVTVTNSLSLNGVTLSTNLIASGIIVVSNGLTLNNATLTLGAGSTGANIYFNGTQTLGGTGHVAMVTYGSTIFTEGGNSVSTASVLTIGPNITIDATASSNIEAYFSYDSVINLGLINSNTSGVTLWLTDTFINKGTVEATAGTLNISATSWTGTGGTIGLTGSGTLTLSGTFSTATLGTLNRSGGTLNFTGTLNNTGTTLALTAATGSWNLNNATINGGTITAAGGATVTSTNLLTLNGVTLGANLPATGYISVTNGLTLNNSTLTLGVGSSSANIYFKGTQTLGGTGHVAMATYGSTIFSEGGNSVSTAAVLTIGPNITIDATASSNIEAYFSYDSVINQGLINSNTSGVTLWLTDTFINKGTVEATAGTLNISASSWTGTGGTIGLSGSGTLTLSGTFSTSTLGSWNRTGGAVNFTGTLNNTGTTLALTAATGSWSLSNATINGGTVTVAGGATLTTTNQLYLNGVTLGANLTATGSVYITNGLTLNNSTLTLGVGNNDSVFYFRGTQTLGGTGHIAMATYGSTLFSEGGNTVSTASVLTIGPNITIDATASSNIEDYYSYDSVINQGVINSNTSGVTIWLTDTFTNQGTVEATAGTLNLSATSWAGGSGTIGLSGTGTLTLSGTFSTASLGTLNRTGGAINFTGTLNNAGATLVLNSGTGSWNLSNATINGGTITASGSATLVTSNDLNLNGVTLGANLTGSGYITVTNGLILNNVTLTLGSGSAGSIYFKGTQTFGGTGHVEMVTYGSYIYSEGGNSVSTAAVLTIGPNISIDAAASSNIDAYYFYDSVINQGVINTSGNAISLYFSGYISGANVTNQGTINASAGESVYVSSSLLINGKGVLTSAPTGKIQLDGALLGDSTSTELSGLQGSTIFNGQGTAASPQLLEVMSADEGAVVAGFAKNFVYGTLTLTNSTHVQLVDQSHNSTGTGAEALYAQSISVPTGCTLDLNGLHCYARTVQIGGTVINGTITQIPNAGPLALGVATPGKLATAGQLDEWTFFGQRGRTIAVSVNPSSNASGVVPAGLYPQLQYANVQLLDASNNVLATASNSTYGFLDVLASTVLPADGVYKIHINAPSTNSGATGNYIVEAYDVTPANLSLNLGQQSSGKIVIPSALDQWNFSATAGQQVQFHLIGSSSPGAIAFKLTGPSGYVAFQDIVADSQLINLPTSGNYTLSAYGLNGTTGSYSFQLNQTSVTALALGANYSGTWAGSGQAQLFSVAVPAANPLSVVLSDLAAADHTEVYVRFGAPPTRQTYDFAQNGSGSSHSLIVPNATAGTWYVLVYGESIPTAPGNFSLRVTSSEAVLSRASTNESGTATDTTLTLTGAGFNSGSKVSLLASNGTTTYPAASSSTDLPTQITANFTAGSVPAGTYTIVVTQSDGTKTTLPSSFTLVSQGQGVLTTHLEIPNPIGRHIASVLYVDYSNTGTAPMPAPLLIIGATNPEGLSGAFMSLDGALQTSGFWTSATPQGYSQSVEILASGATPGVLAPGESMRVPIYYGGWLTSEWDFTHNNLTFSVISVDADDSTAVDWASMEAKFQPAGMPANVWHIIYSGLQSQLGTTAGGMVKLLDANAAYLGRLGENVTDVGTLFSFALAQLENLWPTDTPASAADDTLPAPGVLGLSFSRYFDNSLSGRFRSGILGNGWYTAWEQALTIASDGTVTRNLGGSSYVYQPDSRTSGKYFSQPGDHSTLASTTGGYAITDVNGGITSFNTDGSLAAITDPNGNAITTTRSGGKLTKLTASSGGFISLSYNGSGHLSSTLDSAGRTSTYTYGSSNALLTSVTNARGMTTQYTYVTSAGSSALQALASETLADGTVTNYTYNSQGLLATLAGNGGALSKTYSYSLGEVTVTDALNETVNAYYNESAQLAEMIDALGNATHYQYDSGRNLASITTTLGQSTSYQYNDLGQPTSQTDFLGHTTTYTYGGPKHRLNQIVDANGNATQWGFSPAGNIVSKTVANGAQWSYSYDGAGNCTTLGDPAGRATQVTHDAAGNVTSLTYSDGTVYSYIYDSRGHMTSATDPTGTTTFTFDPAHDYLLNVTYPNHKSLTYTYDSAGRRSTMVDQDGRKTTYDYDVQGRLADLKNGSGGLIVSYTYDVGGRLTRKTHGNGTYTTNQYDAAGHLLHLINFKGDGTINSRFDDTYNALGLKISETTLEGVWTYAYDANGHLTHAVFASNNTATYPNQDLVYNYDAAGNRTSVVINGQTTTYSPNNLNQYGKIGGKDQTFDPCGNLLSDGTNKYTYTCNNQVSSSSGPSGTATYSYNALGQRTSSVSAAGTVQYVIDPLTSGNVIGTYDGSGNNTANYSYGIGLESQSTQSGSKFFGYNSNGDTTQVTDVGGNVTNKYVPYSPDGTPQTSTGPQDNTFKGQGQSGTQTNLDGTTYNEGETYSPQTGRNTSPDPFGILDGPNVYSDSDFAPPRSFLQSIDLEDIHTRIEGAESALSGVIGLLAIPAAIVAAPVEEGAMVLGAAIYITAEAAQGLVGLVGGTLTALTGKEIPTSIGGIIGSLGRSPFWKGFGNGVDLALMNPKEAWKEFREKEQFWHGFLELLEFGKTAGDAIVAFFAAIFGSRKRPEDAVTADAHDPNALYGPTGYGVSNYVTNMGNNFAYRITFENDPAATAPAQSVTITDNLDPNLDWSTFQLTGIGFGDNNLVIPGSSQHYQKTISMTYNGETFVVQMEAGIHTQTGQVYATFQSLNPDTGLPPANVLTGFLPPEDGTGRGEGYLTYTVAPKANIAPGTSIPNVASIVFDDGEPLATNLVNDQDPSQGVDPSKNAVVTIDSGTPSSQMSALPATSPPTFNLSWAGTDPNGPGIASYTVYVSSDGGTTYAPWLSNTSQTSSTYTGVANMLYSFYVVATDFLGNIQQVDPSTAAVSTTTQNGNVSSETFSQWETRYSISSPANAIPLNDNAPNLLKYLCHIDPTRPMTAADRAALPAFSTTSDGDLTLTYRKYAKATGITVNVQTSSDLKTWTSRTQGQTLSPTNYTLQQVNTDSSTGDPIMEVDAAPASITRQFIRLNVTMP